eukprot:TRINITY_DN1703_c1_g1_i6.p4 TRINITY_DN1703_c1_g1~~TRINITY_DN1703_c1_g1_i6.p4  ORF type:complete len:104 (+),score=7.68 TRINITY_DN1703_c1_g1_i6:210-521(+)
MCSKFIKKGSSLCGCICSVCICAFNLMALCMFVDWQFVLFGQERYISDNMVGMYCKGKREICWQFLKQGFQNLFKTFKLQGRVGNWLANLKVGDLVQKTGVSF